MFYFPKQHFQIIFNNDDGNVELINEVLEEMTNDGHMILEQNPNKVLEVMSNDGHMILEHNANVVLREMVNDGHMIIEEKPNELLETIANDGLMILEHNPLLDYDDLEIKEDEYFSAQEDFGLSESEKDMIKELPLR